MTDGGDPFDFVRDRMKAFWANDGVGGPPNRLWERGDLVPIGMFGWSDADWTCLRRDGGLVTCTDHGVEVDFPISAYNAVIGRLMQIVPMASVYLRPSRRVAICGACRGTGRLEDEFCPCGGLGWVDA